MNNFKIMPYFFMRVTVTRVLLHFPGWPPRVPVWVSPKPAYPGGVCPPWLLGCPPGYISPKLAYVCVPKACLGTCMARCPPNLFGYLPAWVNVHLACLSTCQSKCPPNLFGYLPVWVYVHHACLGTCLARCMSLKSAWVPAFQPDRMSPKHVLVPTWYLLGCMSLSCVPVSLPPPEPAQLGRTNHRPRRKVRNYDMTELYDLIPTLSAASSGA